MRELRDDSLIDLKFMMEDSGMGKTFMYSEIKAGRLLSPHKIGSASRWTYADYQNWKRSHFTPLQKAS
jgi:predicted DNA-binding transcriptional regulator AlpA